MRRGIAQSGIGCLLLLAMAAVPCRAQVFYEIVAPDGSRDWLLGTVHVEAPRVLDFPPALLQALRQVDTVALELAPDRGMLEQLQHAMQLPDGVDLSERLPEPLYRETLAALHAEGVPEPRAARMQPWAAAMLLAQPPGASGRFMDLSLARLATHLGVQVEALESVEEQVDFFRALPLNAQIELLRHALARMDEREQDIERIVSVYLDGDLAELERLAAEQLAEASPVLRERFERDGLEVRNRRMVDRAAPLLARESVLIAVGALHLVGPGGLPARLRDRGYEVVGVY